MNHIRNKHYICKGNAYHIDYYDTESLSCPELNKSEARPVKTLSKSLFEKLSKVLG